MENGRAILLLAVTATFLSFPAAAIEYVEETLTIRAVIGGRELSAEALAVRLSDQTGKLPIALVTYWPALQVDSFRLQARDLAKRGWLAVVVIPSFRNNLFCSPHTTARLTDYADWLEATVNVVSRRNDADATRVLAIGGSLGGLAVLALAKRGRPALAAAVNVSGILPYLNCEARTESSIEAIRELGTVGGVPNIWIYGRGNSESVSLALSMHDTALTNGANTKFTLLYKSGNLFHEGRIEWLFELDALLRHRGLPTWRANDVDQIISKLKAPVEYRIIYETYLVAPTHKSLVFSAATRRPYIVYGLDTLAGARDAALASCRRQASDCEVVADD